MAKVIIEVDQVRMLDLINFLNGLSPKQLGNVKSSRKIYAAVEVLEESMKAHLDKIEKLNIQAEKLMQPYRDRLQEIAQELRGKAGDAAKELEEERDKVEANANAELAPLNKQIKDAQKALEGKQAKAELDGNYHAEVVSQFEKHAAERFLNLKAYIEVADALGIEDK